MSKLSALFIAAALLNLLFSNANIIGIDFASDSIKVAIVQPGTPLEIGKFYYPHLYYSYNCNTLANHQLSILL